ncbi:MAG: type I-A CRISPR-associated protein Cas4/Csa1 [Dehalococcoidia bacterium]|nr:type I-A CRISPR-associated protein Cas4/Csa1 [Dehalococcoidia bacterium]
MYFLSEEEKRMLVRRLLPEARARGVAEELRGWNWDKPPLSPVYAGRLGIYEIAGKYCPTSRDVYLRRVLGVNRSPSPKMTEGGILHRTLCRIIVESKRAIYNHGRDCLDELKALACPSAGGVPRVEPGADASALPDAAETGRKVEALWEFEHRRIVNRVHEILSTQPHAGPDSLAALALPVTVEQRLNGGFLGLSPHLAADAFNFSEPMLVDVKFGGPERFHRLATTGYALVMESLYEYPINIGCVVYVSFKNNSLGIERDFHVIDDELRQWFIEERDERMRMVEEEIDPGLAGECPEDCYCWKECYPE